MKSALRKALGHLFWQIQIAAAIALVVYMLFTRPDASMIDYLISMAGMAGAFTVAWASVGLSSLPGLLAFRVALSEEEKRQHPLNWKFCLVNGPATLPKGISMIPDTKPKPGDKGIYFLGAKNAGEEREQCLSR